MAAVFARPAPTEALLPRVEVSPGRIALDQILGSRKGAKLALGAGRRAAAGPARAVLPVVDPGQPGLPPVAQAVSVAVLASTEAPLAPLPSPAAPEPSLPSPPPPEPSAVVPSPLEPSVPVPAPSEPSTEPLIDASFESGLDGWSTAGVGEVLPRITGDIVRDGDLAVAVRLTGDLHRSELILGGDGGRSTDGTVRFYEGDEYWYAFSFYIESMVYGEPGAHNLIMQFKGSGEGSPLFGLQLWDYAGDGGVGGGRGLWSHGSGMGGDRFLSPLSEQAWHDVVIHFNASSIGTGFYEVYLDDVLVDARSGVSMIPPGAAYAYIKDGLYRNGAEIPGTSEIRLDAARLGESLQSVMP